MRPGSQFGEIFPNDPAKWGKLQGAPGTKQRHVNKLRPPMASSHLENKPSQAAEHVINSRDLPLTGR